MRKYGKIYIIVLLVIGFGSILPMTFFFADNEAIFMGLVNMMFAVLTFPFGAIAWTGGIALIFSGRATPSEAIALFTPLYVVLGYLQWFRILPAVYRCGRSSANSSV